MSSWFWLNTRTKPPYWSPLDNDNSNFIQTQYEGAEPRQFEPFYLPNAIHKQYHRIRLLSDVNTRMALDCDNNTAFISIPTSSPNKLWFGCETTSTQEKITDIKQQQESNQMNIDLWTQKILFLNQKVRENVKDAPRNDKWYCLGIGPIKNMWYPFDEFINQKIDQYYYEKQYSFNLDEGSPCLNVRFPDNAFNVDVPFGFAYIVNGGEEEQKQEGATQKLLAIKYRFDFCGFINNLHVSLYPFNYNEASFTATQTQSDCIKLCHILYRIFYGNADVETYRNTEQILSALNVDGIEVNQWMQFGRKGFIEMSKKHSILKKNHAAKVFALFSKHINKRYLYSYNVYHILDVICSVTIAVHDAIRTCILSNRYTLTVLTNDHANDQMVGNMVHALTEALRQNSNNEQQLAEKIKHELKCVKLSDTLKEIIFGDKMHEIYKYKEIEKVFLNKKVFVNDSQLRDECRIYLNEIRAQMIQMINNKDTNKWFCTTSFIIHCYQFARYKEMKRVDDNIIASKYDEDVFGTKGTLDDDKKLERFLQSIVKIKMDEYNRFLLKKIKVRLRNDINEWLCSLFYKQYQIEDLKEDIRKLILVENITSLELFKLGIKQFTKLAQQKCGNLMSPQLAHKLYSDLPHETNISAKNCEEIYNQSIIFIDRWWKEKKEIIKHRCIDLNIDKQSFLSSYIPNEMRNVKTWQTVQEDIKHIANIDEDNDIDFDFKSLTISIRICTENDIRDKNTTFGEWLLNILEDKEEFMIKMKKVKAYLTTSNVDAKALNEQKIGRKEFAGSCDQCDIPRGVATKLYKELIQKTKQKNDMSVNDVYKFMQQYLEGVTRGKKIKIIDRIQKCKIGKHEFVDKYAYAANCVSKIHDFLRNKIEYTKKLLLLKQMAHRIYICTGLANNMYSISNDIFLKNLTMFHKESNAYKSMLNELESVETSGAGSAGGNRAANNGRDTQAISDMVNTSVLNMNIGIPKDIRQLIPEYIYPMAATRKRIDLMKLYVLKHNMDSNAMCDMGSDKLEALMEAECQIPHDPTKMFLRKVKAGDPLSPNQVVDFFSDFLHEHRNKSMKEVHHMIHVNFKSYKEEDFIAKFIKNDADLREFIHGPLAFWTEKKEDKVMELIRNEIADRKRQRKGVQKGRNLRQDDFKSTEETKVEQDVDQEKDFILRLIDAAHGSNKEWKQQQEQIRNQDFALKSMKKTEFSKKLAELTDGAYPLAQSGKLYRQLLRSGKQGSEVKDDVIQKIDRFRSMKRKQLQDICVQAAINQDIWSSKNEATDFLVNTAKLKANSRPFTNIMSKLFATMPAEKEESAFAEWIADVICSSNVFITDYFEKHKLNGAAFAKEGSQNMANDFENAFNAAQLYQHIESLPNVSTLSVQQVIETAKAYIMKQNQVQRNMILQQCKKKKISQHISFIETYGKSMDDLMRFLTDVLELKWSNDRLLLLQHKLHFYLKHSHAMNIFKDKSEFVLWQAKLVCFTKAIRYSSLLAFFFKDRKYDADKIKSMKHKPLLVEAESYGVIKGTGSAFFRELKKHTNNGDSTDVILNKIASLVFAINVADKKFSSLTNKGDDVFIASVADINIQNMGKMLTDLKQKDLQTEEGKADVLHQMHLCLALFNIDGKKAGAKDTLSGEKEEEKVVEIPLDLQSLNEMNSRQIAFITCNVIMQKFIVHFENLRINIITKYKQMDGKELYKLCARNDDETLIKNVSSLEDVSAEQFSYIACQSLKSDAKYSHKIKLLVTKINDLNLDGRVLFEKCLLNEHDFIDEISAMMKFTSVSKESMRSIWKLLYKQKLDLQQLTTDELMQYSAQMCVKNVRSIIIDTKLTGKRFVAMNYTEFVQNFINHPFGCCLAKGPLRQLYKSISTYSFDSDCKYKDFIENDLQLGNSSLSKLIISDFEKPENQQQLKQMNNEEIARWISQYPINQLYDILYNNEYINNAEILQTQLNSSLLDEVCGFSYFIGGAHSHEMIKDYWLQIASNPKDLLMNDLKLILQLMTLKDGLKKQYNDILFQLDQQNKTLYHLLHYSNEIESFLKENKHSELWQIFKSFQQMMNKRDSKFKREWDKYELASFLLQEISQNVEQTKNTKNTLLRMHNHMLSPYEMLLLLNDFQPFIKFSISKGLDAKHLFAVDKKGELIRTLKQKKKGINDQTGDIYIIWIKDRLLRAEYINVASTACEIFSRHQKKRKERIHLQQTISEIIRTKQLTFDRVKAMQDEKEFIQVFGPQSELKIYNERCCELIVKEIKDDKFHIDQKRNLPQNLQIKWFTNYRKERIYRMLYSRKFDWKFFSEKKDENLSFFFDRISVLTKSESDRLFILLHKEYLRRQYAAASASDASVAVFGLPPMISSTDIESSDDLTFYCDGCCHDGRDAIHCIQTSFGQLLLYLKHSEVIQYDNASYSEIKQLWYDTMYTNDCTLFKQPEVIDHNTFDLILSQTIENDRISQVILSTLDAFHTSTFIKALKKYHLKAFITQYQNTNQFSNSWTTCSCAEIIVSFLLKIIKNIEYVFEAKYLFYALLNASCKGREEYEFDHATDDDDDKSNENKYFTSEEHSNIEEYLSLFDYKHYVKSDKLLSCASKYYLRSLLSAIIRVSNVIKKNKFSSIDNSKPKTIYVPITNHEGRFNPRYNLITPSMRYKTSLYDEQKDEHKSYILLRLQSSCSYFGTHFIDLHDADTIQLSNDVFDGYLLSPFIINQMAQTRLTVKDVDKSNDILQYQCTDVNGLYLDKLCPFVTIQQYSNKYFVLFQMFYILGHHKFMLLDNKYISSTNIDSHIFIERVQKQSQAELESFLSQECNLNDAEIHKIMLSTDRSNAFNLCLSNFLYIDDKTLQSMGISSNSVQNILTVIRDKRNKFFDDIEGILFERFPDLESIRKAFTDRKIGSFDDDVFYDEKHLEQFIPDARSRHLLLKSAQVIKGYFKTSYFNYIATRNTLFSLYDNQLDTNNDLKQIFGILANTFSKIKQKDVNINIAEEDDDEDVDLNEENKKKKDDQMDADLHAYEDRKQRRERVNMLDKQRANNFYNELLKGIHQLTLNEETCFDFIFLPNFKGDLYNAPNETQKLHAFLRTYFKMKYKDNKKKRYKGIDLKPLKEVIEKNETKTQCFVMIASKVIGFIEEAEDDTKERESEQRSAQILNCPIDVFSSYLDKIRVYLDVDNKRCATFIANNKDDDDHVVIDEEEEPSLSSTVDRFIYSDKQQATMTMDTFINRLEFECGAASIQARGCLDIQRKIHQGNMNNYAQALPLTDPLNEWDNCDFCVYDIVELNMSNLSFSWKRNHKYFDVDESIYGIVTEIELANDVKQKQYHEMIMEKLNKLIQNDAIKEMLGDIVLDLNTVCNEQPFIWNINNMLKFTHRALQFITVEWHNSKGDVIHATYPNFGHIPFLKRIENIPRIFDVVVYENSLFYVYAIKLKPLQRTFRQRSIQKQQKQKPNVELSIIRSHIGNNDDLLKNVIHIHYERDAIQIVTGTLYKWRISRHESIWYLPIYLNDFVIRPNSSKFPGKIVKIFINRDLLDGKLPLIYVEVDWLIESPRCQNVFVWTGIGNVLLNKQFKYTKDFIIYNELYLVSLACNDRVSRGIDWNDSAFEEQDGGDFLGKITKIEISPKGGYEAIVQWDYTSQEFNYRFGLSAHFDVDIIQRRSKCAQSRCVPMFCGDKIIRSVSWKWEDQDDALGFGVNNPFIITPQVGIVREITSNPTPQEDMVQVQKIHHYIYNTPIDDAVNQSVIVIDWIGNKYESDMSEQEIFKQNEIGLYNYEIRHFDKYRYGYENAFDVTIVGQHTSIPIIPFDKIHNLNEFYLNYATNHAMNTEHNKDVLYFTFYAEYLKKWKNKKNKEKKQNEYDEEEKLLVDRYQKELHTTKANQWPPIIVNKLNNQTTNTFITRFVDIAKFTRQ